MRRSILALVMLATALVIGPPAQAAGCAGPASGGEWPSYGNTLSGTRHQTEETTLAGDALEAKLALPTGGESLQSTAVISDGCLYVGTTGGTIQAFNADTGDIVWTSETFGSMYAVAVHDGRVFGISSADDNSAFAVDQDTGATLWHITELETNGASIAASVVAFGDMVFVPTTGPDFTNDAHPSFSLLDTATGEVLAKTYVIPDEEYAEGYAGGGIWTTAVVDETTGHLYAGTANPNSYRLEHPYTNAIVKIDVDRSRDTFGTIVDHYKGNVDQYVEGLDQHAACQNLGDVQPIGYSIFCTQLDIDFGSSPNMWTDAEGRTVVGELQKSGVYHAVYADTMEAKWTAAISAPCPPCNIATTAVDETSVYAAVTPGLIFALDRETGAIQWVSPAGDYHYTPPVSVANGVVYTLGIAATLQTYDAATGAPLGVYSLGADAGDSCATLAGGVSIARNKAYAVCDTGGQGGWVVAYGAAG